MSQKEPQTYEQAVRITARQPRVWPGCKGNGRRMECGRLHDFGHFGHGVGGKWVWVPQIFCSRNYREGCPTPMPEPTKGLADWVKG